MIWMILAFALFSPTDELTIEVKLPPSSSSRVPSNEKNYDDVRFAQLLNVPADILRRLPVDEAEYIAKEARAGKPVYLSDKAWLT